MTPSALSCPRCGSPLPPGGEAPEFEGMCAHCLATLAVGEESDVLLSSGGNDPGPLRPEPPPLKNGATFKDFEVLELIGRGGMATVYRARQIRLDRIVALKILSPRLAADKEFALRFDREAKALASLDHPNIVRVYDMGKESDLYYLAMEYVDGVNLRNLLAKKTLGSEQALRIVPQLCDALEYAHSQGIVHRDVKPENILLDRNGVAKIADFGIAKIVRDEEGYTSLTETNVIMGTAEYMAPEQRDKTRSVDHRADIYSLGVVLYELLTGELPVGRFELPSRRVRVDVRIDDVVLRALESNPTRRYQKAGHMGTDVGQVLSSTAATSAECSIVDHNTGKKIGTSPDRRLAVRAIACPLSVRGWDKEEIGVRVTGDYQFEGESALPLLQSQVETTRMDVFVPRGVDLELFSDEAGVDLGSIVGSVSAELPEGDLKVSDFQGSLRVQGGEGKVAIDGLKSESFKIHTGSGRVDLTEVGLSRGRGEIETGSGDVTVRPAASASFRFTILAALGMVRGAGEGRVGAGAAVLTVRSTGGQVTLADAPAPLLEVSSFKEYIHNLPKKELEALGVFAIVSAGLILLGFTVTGSPAWAFLIAGIWGMVLAVRLWKGYVNNRPASLSLMPAEDKAPAPPPPPKPEPKPSGPRVNGAGVMGLLLGFLSTLLAGGAAIAIIILEESAALGLEEVRLDDAGLVAFVMGMVALGLAGGGLLFSLTGASAINEARGALRGRGAAHAGVFFSLASLFVLAGFVLNRLDGYEVKAEELRGVVAEFRERISRGHYLNAYELLSEEAKQDTSAPDLERRFAARVKKRPETWRDFDIEVRRWNPKYEEGEVSCYRYTRRGSWTSCQVDLKLEDGNWRINDPFSLEAMTER